MKVGVIKRITSFCDVMMMFVFAQEAAFSKCWHVKCFHVILSPGKVDVSRPLLQHFPVRKIFNAIITIKHDFLVH